MWISSLVRKVLELKEGELKAFFRRASMEAEMECGSKQAGELRHKRIRSP